MSVDSGDLPVGVTLIHYPHISTDNIEILVYDEGDCFWICMKIPLNHYKISAHNTP